MDSLVEILNPYTVIISFTVGLWFFKDKIFGWFRENGTVNQHDASLYQRYKTLFVDNGLAEFYRSHDFLAAFQENEWRPLSEYADNWHRVEFEFVNSRLNNAHKRVYKHAYNLAVAIATYTVNIGNHGNLRSVKPDTLPIGPTPPSIIAQAREINSLRKDFWKAHSKFVRKANATLYKGQTS